jgi:predicted PolB exonuclease-like 3'-5' exonuclease
MYQPRNYVPLDQLSRLAGFPGKLGMDGSKVWEAYRSGRIGEIRNYCETDTANTYLVFLKFQLVRGAYDEARYERELDLARNTLAKSKDAHWQEFLRRWR